MLKLNRVFFSSAPKIYNKSSCNLGSLPKNDQTGYDVKKKSYLRNKYDSVLKVFENTLKRFPIVYSAYETYKCGLNNFKEDFFMWYKNFRKVKESGFKSLSRKELEVNHHMPKNLIKIAPIMIGTSIPFCGFMVLIAYYYPRQLLTYHFWSPQQRSEFEVFYHKEKSQYFKQVFSNMKESLNGIENNSCANTMAEVIDLLEFGRFPNADLILACKPLFEQYPYSLNNLSKNHILGLLRIHDMHRGWRRKKRLESRALLIQIMDAAILREGGLEKLSSEELKWICFWRGLNPNDMNRNETYKWMNTWLSVSQQIDENSYSLLLHCPVLLGQKTLLCH